MSKLSSLSKSLISHTLRSLALPLAASAAILAGGCGSLSDTDAPDENGDIPTFQGKTAEEIASETDAGDGYGKASSNLVSKWIACGSVADFPTWTFWGYTTAEATNFSPGSRIRLSYQSGLGATQIIVFWNFARWGGNWWGLPLYVTYLGYYDSAGYYHSCNQYTPPPADAPNLIVQTY
jgi:hypothetical protein